MNQEKTTLEMIAPTVEEAVQKGLEQLNLAADAVDVEVLDAGSRGLFGLGSRQARVRLTIKTENFSQPEAAPSAPAAPVVRTEPVVAPVSKPAPVKSVPPAPMQPSAAPDPNLTPEEAEAVEASRAIVAELLDKMKIQASVGATLRRAADDEDEDTVLVNIEGDDLSILIGRRTETLNALQYVASLIVGKQLNRWAPLLIDVQGYRARRERQLRVLARRMAEQALHTGRRQVLEPMPANERRVIHLELRDHPQVATESIGDEPNRKITIFLKK
jgi:spoIIIJ-associated protein